MLKLFKNDFETFQKIFCMSEHDIHIVIYNIETYCIHLGIKNYEFLHIHALASTL